MYIYIYINPKAIKRICGRDGAWVSRSMFPAAAGSWVPNQTRGHRHGNRRTINNGNLTGDVLLLWELNGMYKQWEWKDHMIERGIWYVHLFGSFSSKLVAC